VLDVGAGHASHPRADVVIEKYVADRFERRSDFELDVSKPLVVADGHALPFADQTFAYVIASHVLEHSTDPELFASELARVARAGFVQLPSREAELTFGWPFHPWLVDRDGDLLVFEPRGHAHAPLGTFFHRAMADSLLFVLWFSAHRDYWHHSVEWHDRLSVRVEGASAAEHTATFDLEQTLSSLAAVNRRAAIPPLPQPVSAALRCPVDRGTLRSYRDELACERCGRAYPVVGVVPVLLAEAARSS
jgi:SAM-dependent methyltransferase